MDLDPAYTRVVDSEAKPEPVVGLVAGDGDPRPGSDARLVEHTTQCGDVHGLVAIPVERDQFVRGDRTAEFAFVLAPEIHEAAQVQGSAAGIGDSRGVMPRRVRRG